MRKVWAVGMAALIVVAGIVGVTRSMAGEPIPVSAAVFLATCSLGYGIARLAEAWRISLWSGRPMSPERLAEIQAAHPDAWAELESLWWAENRHRTAAHRGDVRACETCRESEASDERR